MNRNTAGGLATKNTKCVWVPVVHHPRAYRRLASFIPELIFCVFCGQNELLDLQIHRPSLEDVFLELTGHEWSASTPEESP